MKVIQKTAIFYTRARLKLLAVFSKKKAAEKTFELFCTPHIEPIKNIPAVFEKAESLEFIFNELKIAGYRWPDPGKPRILILHGFSSVAYKFSEYIELLINKGFEVIAFDAPAHGKSEGRTVNAMEYSLMIKKAIELYGPVNGFIAHSFGAMALAFALENLPHDENTKAVFIAPLTEITTGIEVSFNKLQWHDAAVRKEMDNIIFNIAKKETAWYSTKRAAHNIKAKILWVHDEDDKTTPLSDALPLINENLPNIQFIITKGLGHRRIYHDAAVKEQVVEFLCS